MQAFFDLNLPKNKPYLVLGKGPSFDKVININLADYITIGLNHVCQKMVVDFGHFIDIDCLSHNFIKNCTKIICPVRPHIYCKVDNKYLTTYFLQPYESDFGPHLYKKVYCYNLSTYKGEPFVGLGCIIKVKYFSAEAVFRLLALSGINEIYTLGIDGGVTYSHYFKDLTPLQNGRKTFNDQFDELEEIVKKWNLKWVRL